MIRRRIVIAVIVFSLLCPVFAVSCDAAPEPEGEAWAVIGPDGGVIEVDDIDSELYGLKVVIPAGALNVSSLVSVIELDLTIADGKVKFFALPAFKIKSDVSELLQPAQIIFPLSDQDYDGYHDDSGFPVDSFKFYCCEDEATDEWRIVGTIYNSVNQTLITETNHFSWWVPWAFNWDSPSTVNYYIDGLPDGDDEDTRAEMTFQVKLAFDMWSWALNGKLVFQKVPKEHDDIDITIYAKDFSGDSEVAAEATNHLWPNQHRKIWFNTDADVLKDTLWCTDYSEWPPPESTHYYCLPFFRLLAHEIGHILGLSFEPKDGYPENSTSNGFKDIVRYDIADTLPLTSLSCFDIDVVRERYDLSSQADADGDSVGDLCDNCPHTYNPDQTNSNEDHWGDACSLIAYDDGTTEFGWASGGSEHSVAVNFTPPTTPWTLTSIKVQGWYEGDDAPFYVEIWDENRNELFADTYMYSDYFNTGEVWAVINIPDIEVANDFFVCICPNDVWPESGIIHVLWMSFDDDLPDSGRSYDGIYTTNTLYSVMGWDWMIRAVGHP